MITREYLQACVDAAPAELANEWLLELSGACFVAHESQAFGDFAGHDRWMRAWRMVDSVYFGIPLVDTDVRTVPAGCGWLPC